MAFNAAHLYRYHSMRGSVPTTAAFGPRTDFLGKVLGPGITGRDELLEGARKSRKAFLKGLAHYKDKHSLYA